MIGSTPDTAVLGAAGHPADRERVRTMALSWEDVVDKQFQLTKFREGYDRDQVEGFLDEVVEELQRLDEENARLRARLAAAGPDAPAPATVAMPAEGESRAAVVREPEGRGGQGLADLESRLSGLEEELARLRASQADDRARLTALIEGRPRERGAQGRVEPAEGAAA